MLFVSGEKPDRFAKALASGADLVCLDLEDAVAPARKQEARAAVLAFAAAQGGSPRLAVRLNALRTREGLEDVAALARSGVRLQTLLCPKVEHAQELALLDAWVGPCCETLVPLIESPLGIENAFAIAQAARQGVPRLGALMLGGADLSSELGAAFDWDGLLFARGRLVNAARAAGLQAWDVPCLAVDNAGLLEEETRKAARLGFDCKTAIHPSQIAVIHAALAPAPEEVRWAQGLLQALEARAGDGGAFLHEGRMVDAPVLARARRTLARAQP